MQQTTLINLNTKTFKGVSIIVDHKEINCTNCTITGKFNTIKGAENIINGNHNKINGGKNTINGSHNTINGDNIYVYGDHNTIYGKMIEINGSHNTAKGEHITQTGNYNNIIGDDPKKREREDNDNNDNKTVKQTRTVIDKNGNVVETTIHNLHLDSFKKHGWTNFGFM